MKVKKQQLELDMEQWTGSKLEKEYDKAVTCHSSYLTYMQNTTMQNFKLDKSQARIRTVGRNISNLRYADTILMAKRKEQLKSLLMRVKEESEKAGMKFNMKTKIMASDPITS